MNQISLDINKSGQIINEPVVLRVGDKDQTITVNLLKDGQPYTSFTTATFFANKPSGAIVANDPANISGGTITYTVPQALVNEFGKITNAYFLIDGKVSTENFVIAVLQGVRVSDDLGDLIPGMGNLNVIYDKWKAKLDSIDRELQGIDAPKEVKNVVNNVLKDYVNQLNDLKSKLTNLQTDVNNLKIPEIGTRNYLLNSLKEVFYTGQNIVNQLIYPWSFSFGQISGNAVVNQTATFSVDWRVDKVTTTGYMVPQVNAKPWQINGENQIKPTAEKMSGHYTYTFRVTEDLGNSLSTMLGFQVNNVDGTIRFKNAQLKLSNIETDLTIAQEDFLNDTYNLLPDSKKMTSWVKKMTSVELQQDTDGYNMIHMFGNYSSYYTVVSLKKGKEYTFSGDFKMYNNGPISLVFYISDLDNPDGDGQGIPISDVAVNSWTRMSVTFESKYMIQNAMVRVEAYGDWKGIGGSVFAKKLQLEPGLTSRPWGPNPLDATNLQKQAIFNTGTWVLAVCGSGTDFGDFLKSDKVPIGFSIIRDNNSQMNWKILKESNNTIYGMSQDLSGNIYHSEVLNGEYKGYKSIYATMTGKTITATDDTGKTVKLKITGIS